MVSALHLLRCSEAVAPDDFARIQRRAIFECCKWDPQVEDVSVLAPFALLLDAAMWSRIANDAEALAAETLAAERELIARPGLHHRLGLARKIVRAMRRAEPSSEIARVMRFDFHLTRDGWRISEVNSDVPGGFIESSGFTRLVAEHFGNVRMTGDPAEALTKSIVRVLGPGALVALVHATAYTDDRQVMIYVSRELESRGVRTCLASPDQVHWSDGRAHAIAEWCCGPIDAIVRFFPGEWLANLPRKSDWENYFSTARTPLCNPATALLSQSKRFPLIWDDLQTALPTWRRLLPETRDPRDVDRRHDADWILKPALGRVGDAIGMAGVTDTKMHAKIRRWARWHPRAWAAQERFDAIVIDGPDGPIYPCIGVFTIDGRAAGAYGRAARVPLIDHRARDVAVLIADDSRAASKSSQELMHVH